MLRLCNANYLNATCFKNLLCPPCRKMHRHFHFVQRCPVEILALCSITPSVRLPPQRSVRNSTQNLHRFLPLPCSLARGFIPDSLRAKLTVAIPLRCSHWNQLPPFLFTIPCLPETSPPGHGRCCTRSTLTFAIHPFVRFLEPWLRWSFFALAYRTALNLLVPASQQPTLENSSLPVLIGKIRHES